MYLFICFILINLFIQTALPSTISLGGLSVSYDWWTTVLEQSMLVLIIIARWLMPKGELSREQLSALLLYYLGTASDLVDFFSVLSEDDSKLVICLKIILTNQYLLIGFG